MADQENKLLGVDTSMYPHFNALTGQQPQQQQINPLTQLSQTLQVAGQAQGLQQQQAALGMQRMNYMHDQFGALLAKPNLSFDDIANVGANLVRMKIAGADDIAAQLALVPRDASGMRAWVENHQMNVADHASRWAGQYGIRNTINLGDTQQPTLTDPRTGVTRAAGPGMAMGMTPEANASRVNGVAGGVPFSAPQSSFVGRTGHALSQPGVPDQGGSPASTMAPRGMGSQVIPNNAPGATPVPTGQPVPQTAPTMQPQGLPAGAIQSQQGPGIDATANAQAVANQARAAALQDDAARAPDRKAALARLSSYADTFASGPGSPILKTAGGYVNQAATAAGFQPPVASQAAREAFDKDAAILAGQLSQGLGGTDAGKSLAAVMTPGASNSNEGIKNIVGVLNGLEDAKTAKAQAWDAYRRQVPAGQADFGHFETEFNKSFSPRAFTLSYMTPAERQKTWNSMSQAEQSQVQRSYDMAKANGWIKAPGGTTAPEPPR